MDLSPDFYKSGSDLRASLHKTNRVLVWHLRRWYAALARRRFEKGRIDNDSEDGIEGTQGSTEATYYL